MKDGWSKMNKCIICGKEESQLYLKCYCTSCQHKHKESIEQRSKQYNDYVDDFWRDYRASY